MIQLKWAKNLNRHSPRGVWHSQQAHENMPSIANHQGNVNQNHVRYHLTPVRTGVRVRVRMWRKGHPRVHCWWSCFGLVKRSFGF